MWYPNIYYMRTPEPCFYLKRAKQFRQTSIMMMTRLNRKEIFKYYTRESIKPSNWDFKNQRAKEGKNYPEGWEINVRLEKFRLKFKSVYRQLVDKKIIPTRTLIRDELDMEFFDFIKKSTGLVSYFEITIQKMNNNKLLTVDGKPYSPGTIKTYNTALKHLKEI